MPTGQETQGHGSGKCVSGSDRIDDFDWHARMIRPTLPGKQPTSISTPRAGDQAQIVTCRELQQLLPRTTFHPEHPGKQRQFTFIHFEDIGFTQRSFDNVARIEVLANVHVQDTQRVWQRE
jgi:hypothetical protein